jgi:hypothetical protein
MQGRFLAVLMSVPLAVSGAAGVALHVCQAMGGVVTAACDCESQDRHESHGEQGQHADHAEDRAPLRLEPQPCCTVEVWAPSAPMATNEATSPRVFDAAVAFIGWTDTVLPSFRAADGVDLLRERAPPNIHGPPLFVRNCSFLN